MVSLSSTNFVDVRNFEIEYRQSSNTSKFGFPRFYFLKDFDVHILILTRERDSVYCSLHCFDVNDRIRTLRYLCTFAKEAPFLSDFKFFKNNSVLSFFFQENVHVWNQKPKTRAFGKFLFEHSKPYYSWF